MADTPKEIVPGETIEESLEWIEEMAHGYQAQYGGCAACVVQAVQKKFNLPGGQIGVKACNYAGLGIARMGDTCGALFGAIVCLGLASGRENLKEPAYPDMNVLDEKSGNPKSLETVRDFYKEWVNTFGSSKCCDVQKNLWGECFDIGNPKEFPKFKEKSKEICPQTVGKTARMVSEVILKMPRR